MAEVVGPEVANVRLWKSEQFRVVGGLAAVVGTPLLIAAIALGRIHWSPVLDLAMTELRVRDVGSGDTPLIGLPGRIGNFPDQGSHPGPLSFYLLAPIYRLFGSGAWSLELGSVVIHLVALVAALTLAFRRGGQRLCIAVAVMMAVVMRGYGSGVLTQPWNPYLPVIAWLVVLLAAWSILEGDAPAIVFLVAAGSLCAQTHVPYVALIGGLIVLVGGWVLVRSRIAMVLANRWPGALRMAVLKPVSMPGARRWSLIAIVVGAVLWLPPVADQIRRTPGNFSMLQDYFLSPSEQGIGFGPGLRHLLRHLDLIRLTRNAFTGSGYFTTTSFALDGSVVPGLVLLIGWTSTVLIAWRMRHRALIHLHMIIAAGFVLAFVAMARIFGKLWYYLTFWTWGLLSLCVLAMLWTVAAFVRRLRPDVVRLTTKVATATAALVAVCSTVSFMWDAVNANPPEDHLSETLSDVVGPTADAIEAGVGDADGRTGRYVVTWSDAAYFGSQGYGLVNELERRGFNVGVPFTWRVPVTPQRVIASVDATAEIHLATGLYIEQWRAMPGVEQVAFVDPRSPTELKRYTELRDQVIGDLRRVGLDDLVGTLDTNLFGVQLDPRVSTDIQRAVDQMLLLGQPTAVFIAAPGTSE